MWFFYIVEQIINKNSFGDDKEFTVRFQLVWFNQKNNNFDKIHPGFKQYTYNLLQQVYFMSKKSFDLRYKIAPKFDLGKIDATLENGLLEIFIPLAEEAKPKSIKIK